MSKFYTLKNAYRRSPKKKWWERIFRPKEKWEFDPVLLSDIDGCPPYVGVFYSGDLSKIKIRRIRGECIRGHIDNRQPKLGSKYNITYGDPVVIEDMRYVGRKDVFYVIEKNSYIKIFYIFSNGRDTKVWVESGVLSVKIDPI